jgi:hypothetical protein
VSSLTNTAGNFDSSNEHIVMFGRNPLRVMMLVMFAYSTTGFTVNCNGNDTMRMMDVYITMSPKRHIRATAPGEN